jgi:hypothetical protein
MIITESQENSRTYSNYVLATARITLDPRQDARRGAIDQHFLYQAGTLLCRTGHTLKGAGLFEEPLLSITS